MSFSLSFDAGEKGYVAVRRRKKSRRTNNGKNLDAEGEKEGRIEKPGEEPGFSWSGGQSYSAPQRLKTSEPLVPPKPKLLERA
jgi:hypothetical protein